ncbi:L-serine ammonia-lyase, iron-sulfur-dependent, subunit alpha [Thermosipho atlanticus]|uniref:L-serine dehydratase n=1 Tax=Thermosipho atlanticus DSM 15807 TaxID=1123380 RepID=A0A1M5T6U0_9BACT|nr:L-serine ammonia-lyase, iron-sulfur-dependent, subunit alpha [Thermosipho atlanticus]SHH46449.1 L-serine ammonia-lyase [Thermosipho atlanticus DSM 15807]
MYTWKDIQKMCKSLPLHEVILNLEMFETGVDPKKLRGKLSDMLRIILEEAKDQYGKKHKTLTGMTGENAYKLNKHVPKFLSEFSYIATVTALSIAESNASMGRIVACPTAGASGIIPGVFYAIEKVYKPDFEKLLDSFIVAGGVGKVIANKATISGAAGGCQAEIGTAAAMGAAALSYFISNDPEKVANASALVLKSVMGLVCDPVGGFVEVPCVKRNGNLVNLAISSAELALSGIKSIIPFDEVVDAMKRVGSTLPQNLRETGEGGIANTPTAKNLILNLRKFLI